MTLVALSKTEELESRDRAEQAKARAIESTSTANVQLLQSAIEDAQGESMQAQFNTVRGEIGSMLDQVRTETFIQVLGELQEALIQGYTTDLEGTAAFTPDLEATVDDSEKQSLKSFPVLGHSMEEIAMQLADSLMFTFQSLATGPLRGEFDISQLPQQLENARLTFGNSVSSSVITAYQAGSQASREALRGLIGRSNARSA